MSDDNEPQIPITLPVRASLLRLADGLAARLRDDREVIALDARVDRDAVLRLALERGIASLERNLTMRMLRAEHEDLFDPLALLPDRR